MASTRARAARALRDATNLPHAGQELGEAAEAEGHADNDVGVLVDTRQRGGRRVRGASGRARGERTGGAQQTQRPRTVMLRTPQLYHDRTNVVEANASRPARARATTGREEAEVSDVHGQDALGPVNAPSGAGLAMRLRGRQCARASAKFRWGGARDRDGQRTCGRWGTRAGWCRLREGEAGGAGEPSSAGWAAVGPSFARPRPGVRSRLSDVRGWPPLRQEGRERGKRGVSLDTSDGAGEEEQAG